MTLASSLPRPLGLILMILLPAAAGCASQPPDLEVSLAAPPPTAVETIRETLHGVELRDDYRWLEDQQSAATRAWIDSQNAYTDQVLGQIPGQDSLRELAAQLLKIDRMDAPEQKGGRYFYSKRRAADNLPILYVREGLEGPDRVLLDPHPLSPDHSVSVSYREVSQDGRLAVYAVRRGGADEVELRFRDVDTLQDLAEQLPVARYGSVRLTPDKKGLFYTRYGTDRPRILYHQVGTDPSRDREVFGEGYQRNHILGCSLSEDGRWLLVFAADGSSGPIEIHLKDLKSNQPFQVLLQGVAAHSMASFAGDKLVIWTDLDAPNGRILVADLDNPSYDHWREIIPQQPDRVLTGADPAGGRLLVSYLQDAQPRLAAYDLEGRYLYEVQMETIGSLQTESGSWTDPHAFFSFSSFHVPHRISRLDLASGRHQVWNELAIPIDTAQFEVKQVFYPSKDGTRVPMFLVHRRDLRRDGDNPVQLTGYGGFNNNLVPSYSSSAAAWVQGGGVFAVANLRGGGEYGKAWHDAGKLEKKQNVFDDFIAAAEYLVQENYTRPQRLAIRGGSNGGLLVGAVSNQRPDLFGAVVCSYPLLDMVRYQQFLVARFWVSEYGSSEDPAQFPYLHAYSPYHNVREDARYPATLYITGDADTRVDPLHARKMAALMQARHGSQTAVLLRYHTKAGHSGGQPVDQQIAEMVETLAFLKWQVSWNR